MKHNSVRRTACRVTLLVSLALANAAAYAQLKIVVMAVGQTDAQLIVGPTKSMLIDCGAQNTRATNQYEYVAEQIKEYTGKSSVDYFVISHYHNDHIGNRTTTRSGAKETGLFGLVDLMDIRIGTIIDRGDETPHGQPTGPYKSYQQRLPQWQQAGKVGGRHQVTSTESFDLGGGVQVRVMAVNTNGLLQNPDAKRQKMLAEGDPSENDYSVVLKVTLGKFEYYTGGDVTGKDEVRHFDQNATVYDDVESTYATEVGNVEIMRVSHHGSAWSTNSSLVHTLRPEVSIISSGENNPYEHPSEEVVDRLLLSDSKVYITSGVAQLWESRPEIQSHILRQDAVILVDADGSHYSIPAVGIQNAAAFSDEEEASGLDHPNLVATEPLTEAKARGSLRSTTSRIDWHRAADYEGETVTVTGRVQSVKTRAGITLLSFSHEYWKDLAIVVKQGAPEVTAKAKAFQGKAIEVSGPITDDDGRPQIELESLEQIKVVP